MKFYDRQKELAELERISTVAFSVSSQMTVVTGRRRIGKTKLIMKAKECGTPVISSMGTGNRMDPTKVRITDVYKTSGDPLAKIMRHELKKRGIRKLTVCTSQELPMKPLPEAVQLEAERTGRRSVPGSTAFVPPAAGLAIASFVVRELMAKKESQ